jgi:hypothetical protein
LVAASLAWAGRLVDEADRIISAASCVAVQVDVLKAKAEVDRLAGAPAGAAASPHAALRIYEDRRAVPLTEQTKAALASITAEPGIDPDHSGLPVAGWDSRRAA